MAVAVFTLEPRVVAVIGALHLGLWAVSGLGGHRLFRLVRKLLPFALLIAITSALVSGFGPDERWIRVPLLLFQINLTGLQAAGLMVMRLLIVVMASQIARAGDSGAFVAGLKRLRVPERVALALDATLFLLADTGAGKAGKGSGGRGTGTGRGGGRGKGGGGGKEEKAQAGGNPYGALGSLLRGNVSPLVDSVARSLDRAESHVRGQTEGRDPSFARDVAVIAGISLAMLSLKILKILPGFPFAPGHKGVLLIPLFILAGALTRTRWGATLTGLTMGLVAFLMGDGKYGIFEILKHLTPGLIVDAGLPLLYRPGHKTGALWWSVFGLVIATGRFATIVCVVLLLQAPLATLAVMAPVGAVHLVFGALSGFVTYHLMGAGELVGAQPHEMRSDDAAPKPLAEEVTHGGNP